MKTEKIFSPFIEDKGKTQKVKTKPEKVHKLCKKIPKEMVDKAKDTIGTDWFEL